MFDRLKGLFSGPEVVRSAAKAAGIEAARLDIDRASGTLLLTVRIRGQIRQTPIPTGQTFTIDQVIAVLFPGPQPDPAAPPIAASPPNGPPGP